MRRAAAFRQRVTFVNERQPDEPGTSEVAKILSSVNKSDDIDTNSGEDVRTFYESLFVDEVPTSSKSADIEQVRFTDKVSPNSKSTLRHQLKDSKRTARRSDASKGCTSKERSVMLNAVTERDVNNFLKMASTGDLEGIRKCCAIGMDVNCMDQFGWTALMCAAAAGHARVVLFLLDCGARRDVRDRSGMDALALAIRNGHSSTARVLSEKNFRSRNRLERSKTLKKTHTEEKTDVESYCDACKCFFSDSGHSTSTAHLLATKTAVLHPGYTIPESNRGYRLMLKAGWNEFEGLGRHSDGKRYPIRTVLKRDREGLGLNKQIPKVTHFQANDTRAVENTTKKRPRLELKRERETRLARERRTAIEFRSEFRDFEM